MGVEIQLFEVWSWRVQIRCTRKIFVWGWMKSEVYKEKVNTIDELVVYIMNSAVLIKQERQDDLRRATLLPRVLKSALKSMVGFLNTYFELLQYIEIIYITNKCNQYVIFLFFVPFVRLFMRNIQTAASPHPLKIGHMLTFWRRNYFFNFSTLCI